MKRLVWILVAAALAGGTWFAVSRRNKREAAPPMKRQPLVAVAAVRRADIADVLTATGKVESLAQIDLLPKIEQRIVWMPYREGDRVQAGQTLARLDSTELVWQLDQARAEGRVAAASLRDLLAGSRPEEIAQARALLRQAQATQAKAEASLRNLRSLYAREQLPQQAIDEAEGKASVNEAQLRAAEAVVEDAQRDVERVKHVVEIGGAPQEDLDRAQTRRKTAQAQRSAAEAALNASRAALAHVRDLYAGPLPRRDLDEAEGRVAEAKAGVTAATQKLQMLQAGPTATQVALARERVSQAQTKVASAQTQLAYCTLTSPLSSTVIARLRQAGDMAEPRSPILTLAEYSRLVVRASLPDRDAARLRPGTPVLADVDAAAGKPQRLRVTRIYPAADPASRLVTVEMPLPSAPRTPLLGSLARLSFLATQRRNAVVIPGGAVVPYPGGRRVVFVVTKADRAEMREIQAGIEQNGRIEVLSGVEPGERLVVRGQEMLKDGVMVKVMPQKSGAGQKKGLAGGSGGQPVGEATR